MENLICNFLFIVMQVLIPILIAAAIKFVVDKVGTEKINKYRQELETKQELALLAVRMSEQIYYHLGGPSKLEKAMSWMIEQCGKAGLHYTEKEIRGLIEAALRMIKDEFGEEWAKVS